MLNGNESQPAGAPALVGDALRAAANRWNVEYWEAHLLEQKVLRRITPAQYEEQLAELHRRAAC